MEDKEEILKRFGLQLTKKRQEKKMTSAQLARLTEIDKPHITRLEKGGTNPTLTTIVKLADALEIELHELFEGYFFRRTKR